MAWSDRGRSVCFVLESLSLPTDRRLERLSGWLGEGVSLADERQQWCSLFLVEGGPAVGWCLRKMGRRPQWQRGAAMWGSCGCSGLGWVFFGVGGRLEGEDW